MMSKNIVVAILIAISSSSLLKSSAFPPTSTESRSVRTTSTLLNAYVPDGLSLEQYRKVKSQDEKKKGKNLGALGPRGFKSRSIQAWQEAHDKGLSKHNFAPIGYRQKLQNGTLKKSEVPYTVRGGSWDNSDLGFGRKLPWMKSDKEYAKGGYKKQQSSSILGYGPGFDWTGKRPRDSNPGKGGMPGFS